MSKSPTRAELVEAILIVVASLASIISLAMMLADR
jgi:hypothetical protein